MNLTVKSAWGKKTLASFPEIWFLLLSSSMLIGSINVWSLLIYVGVAVLLVKQILYRNKIIGWALGGLLALISWIMLAAVLSEFREFPADDPERFVLLSVGMALTVTSFVASLMMMIAGPRKQ